MTDIAMMMRFLSKVRLPLSNEKEMQAELARLFEAAGIGAEREVRLSATDIIDFVVSDVIGLECKIKGSRRDIYRQVLRYAQNERLEALVLVTNVPMGMPAEINGKPVYVHSVARAWL